MRMTICPGIHENCTGWLSVAPGTTYFLIITFDAPRQCNMNHRANIGFVYTHAEGDCCNNHVKIIR